METLSTIVINPANSGDAANDLLIFLDDQLNVDGAGKVKTSFSPEEIIYFLVQVPDGVELSDVRPTKGTVTRLGKVTRSQTDRLQIEEDTDEVTLSKIPSGALSHIWYGNEGSVAQRGDELTVSGALPALVDTTYEYEAISYQILAPKVELEADETYPLMITAYTPEDTDNATDCTA